MSCIKINNGFVCLSNINFECPKCHQSYSDSNDKYLNRCNKNKNGYTRIKCECGQMFYMTYDCFGNAKAFL
jgi:hypothetical protein